MEEDLTIVPFVKWAGGKRQLLNKLRERIPQSYGTYFEPFVGSGALFFDLKPRKAVISDLNKELITTYKTIRKNYKRLREYLLLMEYGHSESFFTDIRNIDRNDLKDIRNLSFQKSSDELIAARFIYLNKACFNGIYRVNSNGFFNVPSGKKTKVKTYDWANIELIADYLKNHDIKIECQSYENISSLVKKGDFVYFDPPYDYEDGINGFVSYQKGGFSRDEQKKLAHFCQTLDAQGIKFMVSNHNTPFICEAYKGFHIEIINAKRLVGGKGSLREDVEEVIITNYEYQK